MDLPLKYCNYYLTDQSFTNPEMQNPPSAPDGLRYINTDLSLKQEWAENKQLRNDKHTQNLIRDESLIALKLHNPILPFITNIKIVCNPRRNFINMIVKQEYQDMVFLKSAHGMHCCFFMSNKFEPFVIVILLSEQLGRRMVYLDKAAMGLLEGAVAEFKERYQIQNEGYYYTQTNVRHAEAQGFNSQNRSHGHDFHMKIRISSHMLIDKMPIYKVVNLNRIRSELEVLRYQFENRQLDDWNTVKFKIKEDFGLLEQATS